MDAATNLFIEFLLQELLAQVEELQKQGSLPA
jgi:hypothetical protein